VSRLLRIWWSVAAVMAVAGVAAATTGVAAAQKDGGSAVIRVDRVDATGDEVVLDGSIVGAEPSTLELVVDGRRTEPTSLGTLADGGRNDVVAVIDNASSLGNGTVQLAKRALHPLMPSEGVADSLGVVTTGNGVKVAVGPTGSDAEVLAGLGGIRPEGASKPWDALARAATLLEDRGRGSVGTVVVFTGAGTAEPGAPSSAALSALQRAGVRLDVVALPSSGAIGTLEHMVDVLGGSLTVVESDEDLASAYERISEALAGRFRLTFPAVDADDVVGVQLASGSSTTEISYAPGALRTGALGLAPLPDVGSGGLMSSSLVKWLALLLGVGAVVVAVWTLLHMVVPSEDNLEARLGVYDESFGADPNAADEVPHGDGGQATVPIIQRAVALTEEMAERRGVLDSIESKLEQANLPLRAAEAMFFTAAASVLLGLLFFVLSGNLLMGLAGVALAVAVPLALLNMQVRRRQKQFVSQLPDMLSLLAGTLKAGYSISQGFESVSREIDDPMGRELRRVVTESRLGRPLEEALEAAAQRMDSDDFAWAVMAIRIQREVGGNLAELLMTVADTMTQRERLRRDVNTLTAEGRMSAVVIGLLPPGLAVALYMMNPGYIGELFSPGIGYALVIASLVMMGIGFAWMKKTITIEV